MAECVLITGASRGIGRAAAIACARRGWSVGVNYRRDRAAAEETAEAVRAAGAEAALLPGDVASEADVAAMFDGAEALGRVRGVIANAGVAAPAAPLADIDAARLRQLFEINVIGAYLTAREAARRLSTRRGGAGGVILFVSSGAAILGAPGVYVDYAGCKGAIDTLTRGLAQELGPEGVRVNAVRPGAIETEIHAVTGDPDRVWRIGEATALRRAGKPEEVAEAMVWLLGDEASYVAGAILDVTGGR